MPFDVTFEQCEATVTAHTSPQPPLTHRHNHHSHTATTTTSHTGGSASLPCQVRCSAGGATSRQCAGVRVTEYGALMERVTHIRRGTQPLPTHGCPVHHYPLPVSRHAPASPAPPAGHFGRPRQLGESCDSDRNRLRAVRTAPPTHHRAHDHAICASLVGPDASPSVITGGPT